MYKTNNFKITNAILASKNLRFANYLIDYVAQLACFFMVCLLLSVIAEFLELPYLTEWIDNIDGLEEYFYGAIITVIYYSIIESLTAQSIGKFITNTVVIMEDGSKPDVATILKRSFCRVIPFNALSFFGNGYGWHDRISETFVVKKTEYKRQLALQQSFEEIGNNTDNN